MEAGRELDALVADRVMELIVWEEQVATRCKPMVPPILIDPQSLPHYSTDIAAAWLVMNKMALNEWDVDIWSNGDADRIEWVCDIDMSLSKYIRVANSSAPLAICLAALETVSAETI